MEELRIKLDNLINKYGLYHNKVQAVDKELHELVIVEQRKRLSEVLA